MSEITQPRREELREVLDLVAREAADYVRSVDDRPVLSPRVAEAEASFDGSLPDTGVGAAVALRELLERGPDATVTTSGPRCYHFVIGGVTPAALGADWLATAWDQPAYAWISSPLATRLENLSLRWLLELFDLPTSWRGVFTTGATMANFVGLAAARQWWGERHGVDPAEVGLRELPPTPILSSGFVHASTVKVAGLLGMGRASIKALRRDDRGRLDLEALKEALRALDGAPAILVANAGEVNAGEFDPIEAMADLAAEHGAWLHVDGAFGLFARVSPRTAPLAAGVERADSVTVDGHKWLNVPYDCGYAFVRDSGLLVRAFRYAGDYLPDPDDPRPNFGTIGPESSRRARSLATWATLRAYGREGHRQVVERCLDLAQRMAARVDEAPDLERLAEVPLNIVAFRFAPAGVGERELNALNERLGEALLADGRFQAGTTRLGEQVAFRPALVNWRTRESDVDAFVATVRELGQALTRS